jgi:hypothetical protein
VRTIVSWVGRVLLFFMCLLAGPAATLLTGQVDLEQHWSDASHTRLRLAPEPAATPEAVVQVYAARAFNWRGLFSVHTWIATKGVRADHYLVYHVLGWRAQSGGDSVVVARGYPDRQWYGNPPKRLAEVRGAQAEVAIARIRTAIAEYPYSRAYRIWPGPNSNTFVAYVGRRVPELQLNLPANAIGKDYRGADGLVGVTPSGGGGQISLAGVVGLSASLVEGWEVNILGLGFGINPHSGALRLPGIGELLLGRRG